MIKTTQNRNCESSKRIDFRSSQTTLKNIIVNGTNCSAFEAQIITEKAEEVYRIKDCPDNNQIQVGQMLWRAISAEEPPGKPLEKCIYLSIRLTVHSLEEDMEVMNKYGRSAKRGQQIMRMCVEAHEQKCLLTQEDLSVILDCDVRTIREDIKLYREKYGILMPTRGTKKDIGPGITHREKAVEWYIQGKDALSIARDMNHSLKAVERYINHFCRVVFCQNNQKDVLKTALVMGISLSSVDRYLNLRNKYYGTKAYRARIDEIEKMGSTYWEYFDEKKKLGRTRKGEK
jgi:hypothetical protein